ncbi:MAG: hypothetical protein V3S26_02320 [Acidimicrobiia bacterium]
MNAGRVLAESGLDIDELRILIHPIRPEQVWLSPASPVMMRIWGRGIQAMTLRRRIFVDPRALSGDTEKLGLLIIHELIHVRQWSDLGVPGFLKSYLGDYLRGRRAGLTHRDSYMAIPLEVEARHLQSRFQ